MKLKGISICFSMLKAALCGSYVNFGVFKLYGDDSLDNVLKTFVKLLLSITQSDLLVSMALSVRTYVNWGNKLVIRIVDNLYRGLLL